MFLKGVMIDERQKILIAIIVLFIYFIVADPEVEREPL